MSGWYSPTRSQNAQTTEIMSLGRGNPPERSSIATNGAKYRSPETNFVHVPALAAGLEECHHAAPIYAYDSLSPLVIYTGALITAPETHRLFMLTVRTDLWVGWALTCGRLAAGGHDQAQTQAKILFYATPFAH